MWFVILIGAVFLVLGWGAYAGWNRRWLSRPLIYAGHLGPAMVTMGAGFVLMGLSTPVADLFAAGGPTTASGIAWSVGFLGGLALVVAGTDPASGPTGYAPPLEPIPQRSVQAVVNAAWGGARSRQKDPAQLELLQRLNLLDGRLHPTPAGSLMVARLHWESADTLVIEATPPGRRSVVVTIVAHEVAVLEFRQDWGRGAESGAGLGGFDVVSYRSEEHLGELLRPWVTAV